MATLIDYIKEKKSFSFTQFPLTKADILLLNELAYISFERYFATELSFSEEIVLKKCYTKKPLDFDDIGYDFLVTKERVALLQEVLTSKRFEELRLSYYVNDINTEYERQFAAMVFTLPTIQHTQVIFRGTDDTLIGWKEDFKLTYSREISAHRKAISYLTDYLQQETRPIVVSGHSKGGNLAVYASAYLPENLQQFIKTIYLFDAPGLQKEIMETVGYGNIRDSLQDIRPVESIVGVMLYHDNTPQIIQSLEKGVFQHKVTNWQIIVETGEFKLVDSLSPLSLTLEKTFQEWVEELPNQELKIIIDTFFDTLMESDITSLNDFTSKAILSKMLTTIGSFTSLSPTKKKMLRKSIAILIASLLGNSQPAFFPKIKLSNPFKNEKDSGFSNQETLKKH